MDLLSVLIVALTLSIDCYVVAVGGTISMQSVSHRQVLRASCSFGFFQFAMPILGWLAGQSFVDSIANYDHWVAFALLLVIGARMTWKAFRQEVSHRKPTDITRGVSLLTLSVATSIDALAVGLSTAFVEIKILTASLIIGSVALLVTAAGFYFGRRIGNSLGRQAELIGGLLLIGIGVRIVLAHIL